jgi:hypothetical protein
MLDIAMGLMPHTPHSLSDRVGTVEDGSHDGDFHECTTANMTMA